MVDLEKLTEPFPLTAHKQRQVQGKPITYVEGHTVIRRLNDSTGNNWSMEVKDVTSKDVASTDREGRPVKNTLMVAHVALTIPGHGTREGLGVQMVHERGGEDLVKGCITDALKKAATLFGVGLELYGPDYEAGEVAAPTQPSRPQPRSAAPAPARGAAGPVAQARADTNMIAPGQQRAIEDMGKKLNVVVDDRVVADFNVGSVSMLSQEQAGDLIVQLQKELDLQVAQKRMSAHFATE
jgi:hypothetical protein